VPFAIVAVPFIALIVGLAAWQAAKSWDATFGPILQALADAVDVSVTLPVIHRALSFGWLATAIRNVDTAVRNTVMAWVAHVSHPLVLAMRAIGNAFTYPARELADLTADVAHTLAAYRRVIVPALIAAALGPVAAIVYTLRAQVARLAVRAPVHIVHTITRVAKPSIVNIVSRAIAVPMPRIGRLERDWAALRKRVDRLAHRVPAALTVAALTALVARTAFRWVRCAKVGKVGRNVCGMDTDLLDSLLADTLLIVGTISLVELAEGLQAGMGELTPQIRRFWRA
jgi:hypothetical protein